MTNLKSPFGERRFRKSLDFFLMMFFNFYDIVCKKKKLRDRFDENEKNIWLEKNTEREQYLQPNMLQS